MTAALERNGIVGPVRSTDLVSVIIVSYKTREMLRACLNSVLRQKGIGCEVIVVDNNSNDGSAEMVAGEFPTVTLIASGQNLGFARANNIAIGRAAGNYVLLLNPDAELSDDATLETLVGFMNGAPEVSAAGCRILYPDGSTQQSFGNLPSVATAFWGGHALSAGLAKLFPRARVAGACALPGDTPDAPREVDNLLGACVIVRSDAFREVGPFDEGMFLYFEECDLFRRIRQAGGKVMYIPYATVFHHAGGSTGSPAAAVRHYQDSQEYYLRKHYGLRHLGAFRFALMVSALAKVVVLSAANLAAREPERRRRSRKILWHWHMFLNSWKRQISPQQVADRPRALQENRQA